MTSRLKLILYLSFAISILSFSTGLYLYLSRPKIAFVYNTRLLTEYSGVKEGKKIYDRKLAELRSNLDTLGKELNADVKKFQSNNKSMSAKEKSLSEDMLRKKQQDFLNYKKAVEGQIKEEDQKLSSGVINQINSYMLDYAKDHHYDFIFGVNNDGNVLFAKQSVDVTDDVLKGLNHSYKGE